MWKYLSHFNNETEFLRFIKWFQLFLSNERREVKRRNGTRCLWRAQISIIIFCAFSSLSEYWKKLSIATSMMMMQWRYKNTNSLLCRSTTGEQEVNQHCVHIKVIELEIVIAWSVVEREAATKLPTNIARV